MSKSISRREFAKAAGGLAGTLVLGSRLPAAPAPAAERPNILWILLDQWRASALGCAGHPFIKTPNFDRIAANGVRFTNFFVSGMPCVPSRVAYNTGLYPHQTAVYNNKNNCPPKDGHLAPMLASAGYESRILVGKAHFGTFKLGTKRPGTGPQDIGYNGYDPIDEEAREDFAPNDPVVIIPLGQEQVIHSAHSLKKPDELYVGRCLTAALAEYDKVSKTGKPWYMCLSIDRPHPQVIVPSPYYEMYEKNVTSVSFDPKELEIRPDAVQHAHKGRFAEITPEENLRIQASYFGAVTWVDDQLNRILPLIEADWQAGKVMIIVSADHGAYLGEHGLYSKAFFYREAGNVNFIVSWPGHLSQGKVVDALGEGIDLVPTLADLLHVECPPGLPGTSLAPVIEGKADSVIDAVYNEDESRKSVRTLDWHYSFFRPGTQKGIYEELYDLKKDPHELVNVVSDPAQKATVDKLRAMIVKRLDGDQFPDLTPKKKPAAKAPAGDKKAAAAKKPNAKKAAAPAEEAEED